MTSRQLAEDLKTLRGALEAAPFFEDALPDGAATLDKIHHHVKAAIRKHGTQNAVVGSTRAAVDVLNRARETLREWDIADVVRAVDSLRSQLSELYEDREVGKTLLLDQVVDDLDAFLSAFKAFRGAFAVDDTYELLLAHADLKASLYRVRWIVDGLLKQIGLAVHVPPQQDLFELELTLTLTADDLAARLTAIRELYGYVCRALELTGPDAELRVGRLEVGTMWFIGVGTRMAVSVFKGLLQRTVDALTRRGQVGTLREEIEVALRFVDLEASLRESEVDTTPVAEALQQGIPYLAERFATLFEGQRKVMVDGERYELLLAKTERLLAQPGDLRRIGPGREWRKRKNSDVWHFCRSCTNWPVSDYDSSFMEPGDGRMDQQCLARERRGEC